MAAYLQPQDYAAYGLPTAATDAQVDAASRLIDARIGRPYGLVWSPDAGGNPAWMANKTPTRSFTSTAAIAAGNVVIVLPGMFGQPDVGSAVVIDRADPQSAETCVVTAAGGNAISTSTQFGHAAGATIEFGLTLAESVRLGGDTFRLSASPVAAILGVMGNDLGGRCVASPLGALPTDGSTSDAWNAFPLDQLDFDAGSNACRLLPGAVRGGFARVRVCYVAGWRYDDLPSGIKQATANLVAAMNYSDDNQLPANIKMAKAGDATLMRFGSGLFDADTDALIATYRTIRL